MSELAERMKATGPRDVVIEPENIHPAPNKFRFTAAGELEITTPKWLIRDRLEQDAHALFFGDSETCKTLIALDAACCVATGTAYHDHEVIQGPVFILVGEGFHGISRRLKAWEIRNGVSLTDAPLFVSNAPAALTDYASVEAVINSITELANQHGEPALIAVDTLARNFGPADENSTKDMNAFVAALDAIRSMYGCTILLIHHTGHGDKERSRGSSVLRGAMDSEYRVTRDESDTIRFESTKMKDAPKPAPLAFKIRAVELGMQDDDGRDVTSAVLDQTEYTAPERKTAATSKWQAKAMDVLTDLYANNRKNLTDASRSPDGARVSLKQWRDACIEAAMPRPKWYAAKDALAAQKMVKIEHGFVYET